MQLPRAIFVRWSYGIIPVSVDVTTTRCRMRQLSKAARVALIAPGILGDDVLIVEVNIPARSAPVRYFALQTIEISKDNWLRFANGEHASIKGCIMLNFSF